jgi:hypothetical protein
MDPNEVQKLLEVQDSEGKPVHQDMLRPLVEREEALLRNSTCPACGALSSETFLDPRRPFVNGYPLPNRLLRCLKCQAEYDPHTRLIELIKTSSG